MCEFIHVKLFKILIVLKFVHFILDIFHFVMNNCCFSIKKNVTFISLTCILHMFDKPEIKNL